MSISSAISSLIDEDDIPTILSDSDFGRQWGNLLTLGTIHLSPDVPVVHEFWAFLNETYPTTMNNTVKVRVHDTEDVAVRFIIDNLDERTWALVDFSDYSAASSGTDNNRDNATVLEEDFRYKIRMNYTTLPNTNQVVNFITIGLSTRYQRYYLSGYMTLQQTLNEFAFARAGLGGNNNGTSNNCTTGAQSVWSMPMPTAAYSQNAFFQAVGFLLGLTIAMAYLYPASRSIKVLVEEKETRMRETLSILGVRPWAHWFSWFLTLMSIFSFIAIMVTYTLTSNILLNSNAVYIFSFIFFFSTSTVGFCFVVASFFSRAKLAAIVGPMALFATLLPRFIFFGSNRYEASTQKKWASLLPCTAFAFGADIVADYEYAEDGVQDWNANEGDYSFNTAVGFLFLDTFLYLALGWYLEQVVPRQYGVARPFYFFLQPSYWKSVFCCCYNNENNNTNSNGNVARSSQVSLPGSQFSSSVTTAYTTGMVESSEMVDGNDLHNTDTDIDNTDDRYNNADFESMNGSGLNATVQIQNLVKRYTKNPDIPPAVNHLNLSMYESQITCLLGHNGAGKTSTMSVLTGLYAPTSGDCNIYGHSIVNQPDAARQSMGICPQHNVLFERLTVAEHIAFFQRIKGIRPTVVGVKARADEIGLADFTHTTSSALSGGNKRKLSVAIALCGDPAFLLLDEPTSGMDPASRRSCWELLRRKRQGRVTLLTTHFMDEAELLADRIAVMKEGTLQCCGSGLFLKDRFGLGYNLTIVLDHQSNTNSSESENDNNVRNNSNQDDETDVEAVGSINEESTPTTTTPTNVNGGDDSDKHDNGMESPADEPTRITTFLQERIEGTKLVRKSARELTFRFPQGTEQQFPELFDELEANRESLRIGAYGIANTSLEEVFLQLAEKSGASGKEIRNTDGDIDGITGPYHRPDSIPDDAGIPATSTENNNVGVESSTPVSFDDLHHIGAIRQVLLLYRKRFIVQKRDLKGAFFSVVLPVLLCGLVLLVLTISPPLAGPGLDLSMNLYGVASDGTAGKTDVVVGGGASFDTDTSSASTTEHMARVFADVSSTLAPEYPDAVFVQESGLASSTAMSDYLLETYNDKDHNIRYGALVFDDQVAWEIDMDWAGIKNDIMNLSEGIGVITFSEPLAVVADIVGSDLTQSILNIESNVYNETDWTNGTRISLNGAFNVVSIRQHHDGEGRKTVSSFVREGTNERPPTHPHTNARSKLVCSMI